jgi:hypothetical protein
MRRRAPVISLLSSLLNHSLAERASRFWSVNKVATAPSSVGSITNLTNMSQFRSSYASAGAARRR